MLLIFNVLNLLLSILFFFISLFLLVYTPSIIESINEKKEEYEEKSTNFNLNLIGGFFAYLTFYFFYNFLNFTFFNMSLI